jgi:hypothetical protein
MIELSGLDEINEGAAAPAPGAGMLRRPSRWFAAAVALLGQIEPRPIGCQSAAVYREAGVLTVRAVG